MVDGQKEVKWGIFNVKNEQKGKSIEQKFAIFHQLQVSLLSTPSYFSHFPLANSFNMIVFPNRLKLSRRS